MTVSQDIKLAQVPAIVELYVLNMSSFGGPVIRFSPNTVNGTSNVSFGGQVYHPLPVKGEGWETSIDGAPPRPTLSISNVTRFIQSFLTQYNDLVGARLTRLVTLEKYLDSGASPDGSQVLSSQEWIVEQKKKQDKNEVVFVLASILDNPSKTLPGWKVLRNEFPGAGLYRVR